MAVNKNFVVKNGLEVATDVILADATSKNVGIGSTIPVNTLDVRGGIGATDLNVTGITTVVSEFRVGTGGTVLAVNQSPGRVGVGSTQPEYLLDVRSEVSSGTTALYVQGDVRITGDLNVDDLTLSDISGQSLNISGLSTLGGYVDINSSVDVAASLNVVGVTTLATTEITDVNVSGTATVGTLFAAAGIFTGTSVNVSTATTTKDLLVTGIATIADARITTGILDITDLNVSGVTTSTDKEIYNQFDITNNSSGAYEFAATGIGFTQATDNPTLYLTKGKNYRFSVNASGHPFFIKTVNSTGVGNSYNDGVTNNGAAVGIITFKVPYNAPDILYYNCQNHSAMNGEIRIGGAGAGVGVGSEGTFIGAGATMIDFKSSNGSNTVDLTAGIATVTVQTGVSLGLAIALGG